MFRDVTRTQAWHTVGAQDIYVLVTSHQQEPLGGTRPFLLQGPQNKLDFQWPSHIRVNFQTSGEWQGVHTEVMWWGLDALTYIPPHTIRPLREEFFFLLLLTPSPTSTATPSPSTAAGSW